MRSTSHDTLLKARPAVRTSSKVELPVLLPLGASMLSSTDAGEGVTASRHSTIYPSGSITLPRIADKLQGLAEDYDVDIVFEVESEPDSARELDLAELDSSGPFALPSAGISQRQKSLAAMDSIYAPANIAPLRLEIVDAPSQHHSSGGLKVFSIPSGGTKAEPFTLVTYPATSPIELSSSYVNPAHAAWKLNPWAATPSDNSCGMWWPNTASEWNSLGHTRHLTYYGLFETKPALALHNPDLNHFVGLPDLAVRIAHRLARIPEMPRAHDSVLPAQELIDAALRVAQYLPFIAVLPQIEIDDSTGSISFVWRDDKSQSAFSLEIVNSRSVIGVGVGKAFTKYKPWRYSIADERRIVGEIQSSEAVQRLMLSGE